MRRDIEFTEDFGNRAKGDVWKGCDPMLASQLVRKDKVAKYVDEGPKEDKPAKESHGHRPKKRATKKAQPKAQPKPEAKADEPAKSEETPTEEK